MAEGKKSKNNKHAIEVEINGVYRISCRRWPKECPGPILGTPKCNPKNLFSYKTISPNKVHVEIENPIVEQSIKSKDEEVMFNLKLTKGKTLLTKDFIEGEQRYGVYYT